MIRATLLPALALAAILAAGCEGPAPPESPADPLGALPADMMLREVGGEALAPLAEGGERAQVFIFVRTDCPIANRYAPEINALSAEYGARGVAFWLVYVDPDESDEEIRNHLADYALTPRALRDDEHELVAASGATITPTALVVENDGLIAYKGRIDARYPGFGKARKDSGRRDLALALEDLLSGRRVELASTEAVGCFITDLSP